MKNLYIYWSAIFGAFTVGIACFYDPANAEAMLPFGFDGGRIVAMFTGWPLWVSIVPATVGIVYANRVWKTAEFTTTEKAATIWFLMNAAWYHIGCDVFSGLFQVMPNLTECYAASNAVHHQPMHHPDRIYLDMVYWFELFVQMPLCYLTYWLYLKRSSARPAVEVFLCGLHLTGTVAYYLPALLMGETTHPVFSNLDRSIATLWIIVPILLTVRAMREIQGWKAQAEAAAPAPAPT